MSIKVEPLTVEAVDSTCLAPFARRLADYGYAPTLVQRRYGKNHRGLPDVEAYYRFVGGAFRITFFVARHRYRFAVHDGVRTVYTSQMECSPMHMEPAFLAVYRDTEPLEIPRPPIRRGRKTADPDAGSNAAAAAAED